MSRGGARSNSYWRLVLREFSKRRLAIAAFVVTVLLVAHSAPRADTRERRAAHREIQRQDVLPVVLKTYDEFRSTDWPSFVENLPVGYWVLMPPVPRDPSATNLLERVAKPSAEHLMGTDDLGRDVLARMIWGSRISLSVGFVSEAIAVVIGVIVGAVAGYFSGKTDIVISRIIEVVICFPAFFLLLTIIALVEKVSIYYLMLAIGIVGWTGIARLVRAEFLRLREQDFAVAARGLGVPPSRIIFRHVLPNAMAPVLVSASFGIAGAILAESGLSFLGFGVPPPVASWGSILSLAQAVRLPGVVADGISRRGDFRKHSVLQPHRRGAQGRDRPEAENVTARKRRHAPENRDN